jgi:hypothetical protein
MKRLIQIPLQGKSLSFIPWPEAKRFCCLKQSLCHGI